MATGHMHSAQYVLEIGPPYAYALLYTPEYACLSHACVAMATGHMHSAQYVLDIHIDIGPPYAYALLYTHAYACLSFYTYSRFTHDCLSRLSMSG